MWWSGKGDGTAVTRRAAQAFVPLAFAALMLWGCAGSGISQRANAAASIAQELQQWPDTALVSDYPELMRRDGAILTANGMVFRDEGICEEGDCVRHRVDGVWHERYVGVGVGYPEHDDYLLVVHDSLAIPIGSRPIPSPSGKRFFTGHHDDREWSPSQGASVWEWEPGPRRLRIVDTDLVVFDSFVAWRGDSCVEFIGARGYRIGMQPMRTFWLAEQHGDWQLLETRPGICAE